MVWSHINTKLQVERRWYTKNEKTWLYLLLKCSPGCHIPTWSWLLGSRPEPRICLKKRERKETRINRIHKQCFRSSLITCLHSAAFKALYRYDRHVDRHVAFSILTGSTIKGLEYKNKRKYRYHKKKQKNNWLKKTKKKPSRSGHSGNYSNSQHCLKSI